MPTLNRMISIMLRQLLNQSCKISCIMATSSQLFAERRCFLSRHVREKHRRRVPARWPSSQLSEPACQLFRENCSTYPEKIFEKLQPQADDHAPAVAQDFGAGLGCAPAFYRNQFRDQTRWTWDQRRTVGRAYIVV